MILSSPWWCWLSLLALLPWVGPWRGSDRVQSTLRSLVFVALAFALAQPRFPVDDHLVDRVLIVDFSESVEPQARQTVVELADSFADSERAHLVAIGKPTEASAVGEIQFKPYRSVTWIEPNPLQGSSPLSAALSRAASLIPIGSGGSVTIASDALATRADDDRAVSALLDREIPIHWVELPAKKRPPTPVDVSWVDPLRKGSTSRLNVRIVASDPGAAGEVALKQGDKTLATAACSDVTEQTVVLEFEPNESGFVEAEVVVGSRTGQGRTEQTTQSLRVVLPIQDAPTLLYLGDRQTGGAQKIAQMIGPSFDIRTVGTGDSNAMRAALDRSDLILFDDLPAESLPKEAEQQIVGAVQNDGLGLVMSGGRASFGAGGWHDRPMETLLPVEFVQKEEKRDPSTSLVIVIDTSGSMSGVRVQLAKEVARLAMRRLLPHDKVGIVEFYGAKRWAAPLQPASNAIELQRALNRMDAGGGTVILPALEEAFYGLQNVDTRYKHVLVLTDGGVESGDFESLMRRMAGEGINVSTVLAGGGYHSEFLVNLANWGKGRFYDVPNRFNLPEILLKQPSTTKLPSYRPGVHAVRTRSGAGWWGDIDTSSVPSLAGYVESKPRPGSQVLLETVTENHPILSTWRYGLGRVTTMTTEPVGEGTEPWQQWPEYAKALTRILQRSAADARDPFRFEVEQDGGEVIVHAIRQQPRGESPSLPIARVIENGPVQDASSDGDAGNNLIFVARSPDHFVTRMPSPSLGETLRIETSATTTPARVQPLVVSSPAVAENFVDPQSERRMARLVSAAGGKRWNLSDDWTDAISSEASGRTLFSLGSWLFGIALLLFLAEIIWRRLPVRSSGAPGSTIGNGRVVRASMMLSLLFAISAGNSVTAQTVIPDELAADANALIDRSVNDGVDVAEVTELFRRATLYEGTIQPLLDWLLEARGDLNQPRARVVAEIEAHLSSRRGDLSRASKLLERILEVKGVAEQRQDLRLWQAKLYDALGEVNRARQVYESLLQEPISEADQQTVRLRLALMGLISEPGNNSAGGAARANNDAKPLIELAENSTDVAFRNRAAIVLAVQNKYPEAIGLFTIEGEGTERFRNASRVTEWAIRAQNRDKAIESAWDAVNSAELDRDRNYALSLLVESYRLKEGRAGLEKLAQELKAKNDSGETLSTEAQTVWINLLRELGQYDEAIELFQTTQSTQGFTVEMRRELLEMEGEAGYEDRMIESYRKLIQSEPNELTWRSGLTQVLLEKGLDDEARSLWRDFILETDSRSMLLAAAQTLGEFGIDDLAERTVERMVQLRANHGQALLYWADLQQRRGEVAKAEATLNRIQAMDDIGDDVRAELASSYERLGRQDKAIEVNEAIRASRETVAEDLEMRLAWLYSEVGDEEKALEQWVTMWRKTTSIPRRRYVEDRLMTVASRLGTLADIAIELEEKLADGTADDREAGLLIRIYSRVNDSVAATEIAEDYMARSGKDEVERLQEQGRIYQICNDYWNYEKIVERLIEVDPEGKTEYLRQLALSMLERGKAQEARDVLMTLRSADDGKDSIGGEFEAGVLSLVGLNAEAAKAYWKGIATYPDRIESYLLLANLLKEMDQTDRAVGMFQYLAENADRDDLFTIAIDGILNMEARGPIMQWARRITLERLAGREDKNYLYQLLSDLSAEVNDQAGQIRAMENSLAVSGTRRLSVLRECMELSSNIRGGVYYSGSSRGPSNRGNQPFFAFGRRLIGLGELMPPQVFLDLGQAFLDDGDTRSAERTFGLARNLADPRAYQREVALIFEKAEKIPEALVRFDKLLRTSPSDVELIARVAKLNEQVGNDEVAFRFYQRGVDLLLAQTPLTTQDATAGTGNQYWAANRDAYDMYSAQLQEGLLVTLPDNQIDSLLNHQFEQLKQELQELDEVADTGRVAQTLSDAPRIDKRSTMLRDFCFTFDRIGELEAMDQLLIDRFVEDRGLGTELARRRIARGRYDSVQRMLETAGLTEEQRQRLAAMLGRGSDDSPTSELSPRDMWQKFLPVWMNDDREAALRILRRVDQNQGRAPGSRPTYVIINGVAVPQNTGSASDVTVWMRLASLLGDEGLALQFARSRLAAGNRYTSIQNRQLFDNYRELLPEDAFADLVRYAANLYKDDKERLADYLWLVTQMPDYLGDEIPSDRELLQKVEDSDLQINYYFPFQLAMEVFPTAIRAEAMAETFLRIVPSYRPRELVQIPFNCDQPIDDSVAEVLLSSIESGINPALQDNYLKYCTYTLPRSGTAVRCPENAELAIKVLDRLMTDDIRKRDSTVADLAQYMKAIVLHQSGQTEQAMEIAMPLYDPKQAAMADPYVRFARDWLYRELIPVQTDAFLAKIEQTGPDGKPTVAETDQRLALVQQAGDETRLRREYQTALEIHPDQSKYASAYERWEQSLKRVYPIIEMTKHRLEQASGSEQAEANAGALKKQLGDLWLSVNHLPKALPYWSVADDQDREAFAAEEAKRLETQNAEAKNAEPDKPADQGKDAAVDTDQTAKRSSGQSSQANQASESKASSKKKEYAETVTGLKNAVEDEDWEAAQHVLRKIWRNFPPAVASPYGYRSNTKRLGGLVWPGDTPNRDANGNSQEGDSTDASTGGESSGEAGSTSTEDSEAARQAAAELARQRARGGLASFTPVARPPQPLPTGLWQVLSDYPFAISEMNRILRTEQGPTFANVRDVSLALLQADRKQRGDEAVFASLVEKIHVGNISEEVLLHLFTMLEEDYGRINEDNESVIDDLLERLDLTDGIRASQLANLCARVGQTDRAEALYRHCALLTTTGSTSFAGLVAQARETFQGDELLELAETMFALTNQSNDEAAVLLDLRREFLDQATAAERSRPLFEGESKPNNQVGELRKALRAVPVFARAGDYEYANKCLGLAIRQHGQPIPNANNAVVYYVSPFSNRNLLRISRTDLIDLFPEQVEDYADYEAWLREASDTIGRLAGEAEPEILVETWLTIALRQCQQDRIEDARQTLSRITDEMMAKAGQHESLAIDILRLAGMTDQAFRVQQRLYEEQRLSHLRFGDLLRDAVAVEGQAAAGPWLDRLTEQTMDEDLIRAAEEIAMGDEELAKRAKQLRSEWQTAQQEYDQRVEAARKRAETRRQWQAETAGTESASRETGPSGGAVRSRAIRSLRMIPATRVVP